jgi:hypothetical protein
VHINRTDLKDKDGNLGLQLNTTSYKIIPQQVVDDETQRQNLATLVPTRQTPSNIQQHVIDKKIQFSKLEEAASSLCQLNLDADTRAQMNELLALLEPGNG